VLSTRMTLVVAMSSMQVGGSRVVVDGDRMVVVATSLSLTVVGWWW